MIKNTILTLLLTITLFSCAKKEGSMLVQGTIIGLKKGTLYLQKMQDTILTSVDSVVINGTNTFTLVDDLIEPELYYLTLNEKQSEKIEFFGEKGTITINTKLEKFNFSAKISGSKSHALLKEFRDMASQFSGKRLDLIKETFEAQRDNDNDLVEKLDKDFRNLQKNRYRYTATFAIRNKNSEVAPFIALTELYNAHISLLDTVNNSLSKKIKRSKYGKQLDVFINEIKTAEAL